MTAPGGSVGRAYVSFHADTSRLSPELEAALNKAARDADDSLDIVGKDWGDTLSNSASKEIEKHGPQFAKSVEKGFSGQIVRMGNLRFKLDRLGNLHDFDTGRFAGRLMDNVIDSLENAITDKSGPLAKIGEGISDAIGAGFNISGRSPLIALLIPVFGAVALAIGAAIQAVNAFIAVLLTLPTVIGALGLQVGALFLAFKGVGEAISGAFSAKDANELNEAIKNLTPSAQAFVRSLLPIRDFFKAIQYLSQQNFFAALGDSVTKAFDALGPTLYRGLPMLATALGGLFRDLALFFGSASFVSFVHDVIPATTRWLASFGPALANLLGGLIRLADTMIPFLERLGGGLNNTFGRFVAFLDKATRDPAFQKWLNDMYVTLQLVGDVLDQATAFVISFLSALNEAGGQELLGTLADSFEVLAAFFASDIGKEGLQGLINLVIGLTAAFVVLVLLIGTLSAGIEFLGEAIVAFFSWLFGTAVPALGEFFGETLPTLFLDLVANVADFVFAVRDKFAEWFNDIVEFFATLPSRVGEWLADLGQQLVEKGTKAAQDFIHAIGDGIRNLGPWLGEQARQAISWVAKFLPGSPAELGPLSGSGYALYRGQNVVKDLAKGMETQIPTLAKTSNDVAGSVFNANLNFYGQQPTETQARRAGRVVSEEFDRQINMRDIQLAVRVA